MRKEDINFSHDSDCVVTEENIDCRIDVSVRSTTSLILRSNGESVSSASSFEIDFDPSAFEAQMLSAISNQISIDSADFYEDFETAFIISSEILGRDYISASNNQCLFHNDSSIGSILDFLDKKLDAYLALFRVISLKSSSKVPTKKFS